MPQPVLSNELSLFFSVLSNLIITPPAVAYHPEKL
jgi:hypothetical protein